MKTGKIIITIIFVLSLSFNAAFIIHLINAHPAHSASQETPVKLDLTDEQKKQIEPIRTKMHRENEAIKKQIAQCQEKLLSALKSDPVDKNAINNCLENISSLQKKIQQNTIEEIIHIREHMNPEQCNCLIEGLGSAMAQSSKPCDCPYCQSHKNNKEKKK
jgi:Spy/CpxP family protein refolding chaperone